MAAFSSSWQKVDAILNNRNIKTPINSKVMERFLELYFEEVDMKAVYAQLPTHIANYRSGRDILVSQGNGRVLPGVSNGYLFLAALLYGAGETKAADTLTEDYLNVMLRTLNKGHGKRHYLQSEFGIRQGLRTARDLVAFLRQGKGQGFSRLRKSKLYAPSLVPLLQRDYVKGLGCHSDIHSEDSVKLYNLVRQLDNWASCLTPLPQSKVAPRFSRRELFTDSSLMDDLGVRRVK